MSMKITGLDELQNKLKKMQQGARELNGTHNVSFSELFPASFMKEHTSFSSIDELVAAGGFNVESASDFESIPKDELDKHISSTTRFKSWKDMLDKAVTQYTARKLGL